MGDDVRGDAVQVERDRDARVGIDSEHRHDEWRIVRCWGGERRASNGGMAVLCEAGLA